MGHGLTILVHGLLLLRLVGGARISVSATKASGIQAGATRPRRTLPGVPVGEGRRIHLQLTSTGLRTGCEGPGAMPCPRHSPGTGEGLPPGEVSGVVCEGKAGVSGVVCEGKAF